MLLALHPFVDFQRLVYSQPFIFHTNHPKGSTDGWSIPVNTIRSSMSVLGENKTLGHLADVLQGKSVKKIILMHLVLC